MSLNSIGLKYRTDKASSDHGYLEIYEREINPGPRGSLLELGWLDGASMRMWREWLPRGWRVAGLDREPKEAIHGVNFVQGNQDDPQVIGLLAARHGLFDVIVDDASHESPKTITSLCLLWPYLNPGGCYFVEDLRTSYYPHWWGNSDPDQPGARGKTIMQFLKDRADEVQGEQRPINFPDIQQLSFWPGLCLLRKAL